MPKINVPPQVYVTTDKNILVNNDKGQNISSQNDLEHLKNLKIKTMYGCL